MCFAPSLLSDSSLLDLPVAEHLPDSGLCLLTHFRPAPAVDLPIASFLVSPELPTRCLSKCLQGQDILSIDPRTGRAGKCDGSSTRQHQAAPGNSCTRGLLKSEHPHRGLFSPKDLLLHCGNVTRRHASQHLLFLLPIALRRELRSFKFAL